MMVHVFHVVRINGVEVVFHLRLEHKSVVFPLVVRAFAVQRLVRCERNARRVLSKSRVGVVHAKLAMLERNIRCPQLLRLRATLLDPLGDRVEDMPTVSPCVQIFRAADAQLTAILGLARCKDVPGLTGMDYGRVVGAGYVAAQHLGNWHLRTQTKTGDRHCNQRENNPSCNGLHTVPLHRCGTATRFPLRAERTVCMRWASACPGPGLRWCTEARYAQMLDPP